MKEGAKRQKEAKDGLKMVYSFGVYPIMTSKGEVGLHSYPPRRQVMENSEKGTEQAIRTGHSRPARAKGRYDQADKERE